MIGARTFSELANCLRLIVGGLLQSTTPGHAAFTTGVYPPWRDAFGNVMARGNATSGAFAWRGGEGSVTDRHPGLVYMQARHYDPKIGRFIQADTVLLASMTTQGMNRYAYAENDPVNMSDPTGHSTAASIAKIVFGAAAFVLTIVGAAAAIGMVGSGAGAILLSLLLVSGFIGAIGSILGGIAGLLDGGTQCTLKKTSIWMSIIGLLSSFSSAGTFSGGLIFSFELLDTGFEALSDFTGRTWDPLVGPL